MRILVYGAGVQGCELAHRLLQNKKNVVTMLARGEWKERLDQRGLVIRHWAQCRTTVDRVATIDTLAPDGTWMIVEPAAGDRVEDNLNPVGRAYYGFSTLLCVPSSLSQEVGLALGAQAGEAGIRKVVTEAGFTRFRRAAETPFNLVYEARP